MTAGVRQAQALVAHRFEFEEDKMVIVLPRKLPRDLLKTNQSGGTVIPTAPSDKSTGSLSKWQMRILRNTPTNRILLSFAVSVRSYIFQEVEKELRKKSTFDSPSKYLEGVMGNIRRNVELRDHINSTDFDLSVEEIEEMIVEYDEEVESSWED